VDRHTPFYDTLEKAKLVYDNCVKNQPRNIFFSVEILELDDDTDWELDRPYLHEYYDNYDDFMLQHPREIIPEEFL